MKDRELIRVASLIGFIGAVLAIPANLLHPKTAGSAVVDRAELIASSSSWNLLHWVAGGALLMVAASFVALERHLRDRDGWAWARLTVFAGTIGIAVGMVITAIDGFGLKAVADAWAAAGGGTDIAEFQAFNAVEQVSLGLFNTFIATALGAAPLLAGIAVLKSRAFNPALGYVGIVSGVMGLVLDTIQNFNGVTALSANYGFTAIGFGVTVFLLGVTWNMFQATRAPVAEKTPAMVAS